MSEPRPIPEALLERYLAGDLQGEALTKVERALADSPSERARLEALRADSAAFLIKHPPGPIAAKLEGSKTSWRRWFMPIFAAVAALFLVTVFFPRADDEVTVKGAIALSAFRQGADGAVHELQPGEVVRPGDRLRFSVKASEDGFLAVLSRDGAGHPSVYFPFGGATAAPHRAAQPLLAEAVQLDAVLGPERVWAIFGKTSFELEPLVVQVKAGEAPHGKGLLITSMDWVKE